MKERIYTFIPYLLLCVLYIGCIWYLDHYFVLELDDDVAAEMIFSHALAQDDQWRIMTEDWVYFTELRVFNTQIVYGFLFHFFTNWHTVRIVGNVILCNITIFIWIYFVAWAIKVHFLAVVFRKIERSRIR